MTTQSEQILEYIDGMLDPGSEQALFDALARQPELRLALRQFISISDAVRADREAYAPPAFVERSLMAGIGLSPAELGLATSIGFFDRLGMLAGRYLGIIAAFILGLLLSGVTVYFIMGGGEDRTLAAGTSGRGGASQSARAPGTAAGPAVAQSNGGAPGSMPGGAPGGASAMGSTAATQGTASARGTIQGGDVALNGTSSGPMAPAAASTAASDRAATNVSVQRRDGNSTNISRRSGNEARFAASDGGGARARGSRSSNRSSTTSNGSNPPASSTSTSVTIPPATNAAATSAPAVSPATVPSGTTPSGGPAADARTNAAVEPSSPRTATIVPLSRADAPDAHRSGSSMELNDVTSSAAGGGNEDGGHGFITEARYQFGGSLNESNARSVGTLGRDAYAMGAYWQFNSSLAAGIEGGNESYDQTLRYRNSDTLQIDQRPNYFWGGLSLRYYLGALSIADVEPYLQTTFGGTSAGPIFRFRLGAQYELGSNVSATLSGEFSSLFYKFDQQSLTSGRWGVTGGIQYTIR